MRVRYLLLLAVAGGALLPAWAWTKNAQEIMGQTPGAPGSPRSTPRAQPDLVPAALPAGTSALAAQRWQRLCQASTTKSRFPAGESLAPKAFEFQIAGSAYGGEKGAHDFNARYRFLEPNYLSITTSENQRTRLRGPKGDFLIENDGRSVRLEGREFQEDLRELDEQASLSRTFAKLTEPARMRLTKLEAPARGPDHLPGTKAMQDLVASLDWLLLESPDLAYSKTPQQRVEAHFGLDRKSSLPALVLFLEISLPPEEKVVFAQLLRLKKWETIEDRWVPLEVRAFAADPAKLPFGFEDRPHLDLWLDPKKSRFLAPLTEADFLPPQ